MRTLVLDKSALVAAPQGFLLSQRRNFSFLLTDTLKYETLTGGLEQWKGLPESEQVLLKRKNLAILQKAIDEAGNEWVDSWTAIEYEVTRGRSARHVPRTSLLVPLSDRFYSSSKIGSVHEHDANIGNLASVVHAPGDQQAYEMCRSLGEKDLFQKIRHDFSEADARNGIAKESKASYVQKARSCGWEVSPRYRPGPGWLTFGTTLAFRTYVPIKFRNRGDGPADRAKPPNPFFDMIYVAYVSIANGILSSDKDLLKLAWACWPEKEHNLFYFSQKTQTMSKFGPKWRS